MTDHRRANAAYCYPAQKYAQPVATVEIDFLPIKNDGERYCGAHHPESLIFPLSATHEHTT